MLFRSANLPGWATLSPHSARHTVATLAKEAGADVTEVQDLLGHASILTTQRYFHNRNNLEKSPVWTLGDLLRQYSNEQSPGRPADHGGRPPGGAEAPGSSTS